jgi:uncharacterized membrane protein YgdD (TMEM256/DUF423 family)
MLAVLLGAFGAHGLKSLLSPELMAVYQTGVQYHFYHSLALLAVGVMLSQMPALNALRWSGWLFLFGMTVFSGSLYLLSVSGIRWLGAITPIGGVAMVAGWLLLAWAGYQWPRSNK